VNIIDAIDDQNLFAKWFRRRETWQAWRAFLAALFGLPLSEDQLGVFRQHTGRSTAPTRPIGEAWLICGRRAGKSFVIALVGVFLACFKDYRAHLQPGERGTVLIVARDRRQARVISRYIRALLTKVPMLAARIERETSDSFDLTGSVSIEVGTASFRSVRGYTIVAALLDELAFWPTDDSAEPDYAILDALRPGMATIPGSMLLCASSPYARRGALHDAFTKHYGREGDPILVWKATTREMNPSVSQATIDAAMERDPAVASAEWLAEFRVDCERFLTLEAIEACVSTGVHERAPISGVSYYGFVDPSGGASDSFTCAVGHREGNVAIIDAIRERRPPFKPEAVVAEFAGLLKRYRVFGVRGDRYAGEWPRDAFMRNGITYVAAGKPKSDLYAELLPHVNSGEVDLLDHPRLTAQLQGLERMTARGGRDSIDHGPGQHDDIANAVAGVCWLLNEQGQVRIVGDIGQVQITSRADPVLGLVGHAVNPACVSATLSPPSGSGRFDIPENW